MKVRLIKGEHYSTAIFYCPGCKEHHSPTVLGDALAPGPIWDFNNDFERPTFTPSILVNYPPISVCHSFVTDGNIQFLSDCTHELAGQTVELPDLAVGGVWNE